MLEKLFETIHVSIAIMDPQFNFVRVNRAYAQEDGRSPDFFPGKNHFELYPNEENQRIFADVARSGKPYFAFNRAFSYPAHPERGVTYWDWSLEPLKDESGAVTGLMLTMNNVTERERARQHQQQSENLFMQLFDSAADAYIVVDQRGKMFMLNDRVGELLDYSRDELLGQPVEMLLPDKLREAHASQRGDYLKSPHSRPMNSGMRFTAQRKDGSTMPADIMLSPFETMQGPYVLVTLRDMTEKTRLEQDLRELRHRVLLKNDYERVSLARDLHDGPMQDLYAALYMMEQLKNAPEARIETAGEITRLIRNVNEELRDVCSNLRSTALDRFGLKKVLKSEIGRFQQVNPSLKVGLEMNLGQEDLPSPLNQHLFWISRQLLMNVARHSQAEKVQVRLFRENGSVVLEVQDDGVGFEPPERWVALARENHFGLIGVKERVEGLAGCVEVESAPGRGTVVRAVIPVQSVRADDDLEANFGLVNE